MPTIFLLKLLLVPVLICLVTLAGRRWGPAVAGSLSALPVVAGPILLAITLEQGAGFAATAAASTLLAVIAILVFGLSYAWACRKFGVAGSLALSMLAYAGAVAALQLVELEPVPGFLLVVALLAVAPRLFPAMQAEHRPPVRPVNDLPLRMLAGALLSVSVTYAAAGIGPRLSGFFAMFPVMGTVLVGFSHHASGRAFAVSLLLGMARGYYAFATFCLLLSLSLPRMAVPAAFGLALAAALAVQMLGKLRWPASPR